MMLSYKSERSAFTLVELLIVVAILAALVTTLVLILNPTQFIAQGRDARRVSDLKNLDAAISLAKNSLYETVTDTTQANIVYTSLPDLNTDGLCTEYTLPLLGGSWQYRCRASTTNLRKVDGAGWIPINLSTSPLAVLPVDPVNNQNNYYTYSWDSSNKSTIAAKLESEKYLASYANNAQGDGGNDDLAFETWPIAWAVGGGPTGLPPAGYGLAFNGSNNYVKVVHGATGSPTGGNTLQFDGTDDRVKALNSPSLNPTSAVTIEAWIKPASVGYAADYRTIIGKSVQGAGDVGGYGILSNENQTGIGFYFTNDTGASWMEPNMAGGQFVSVYANRWYHIVGSYDSAQNLMKIYINGDLIASGAADSSLIGTTTKPLYIGGDPENNSPGTAEFQGLIDGVRIYSRALTDAEVMQHFMGQFSNNTGLAGLWNFDEGGSSCTTSDASGSGNNGALEPTCPSNSPLWVDNSGSLNIADKITVEAWIKPATTSATVDWRTVIGKQTNEGAEGSGYNIFVDEDQSAVYFHAQTLWRVGSIIYSKAVYVNYDFPAMDQWYHVVGMYDKDTPLIALYINGQLKDNVAKSSDPNAFGKPIGILTKPLYIGGDPEDNSAATREFLGNVDEVRIYHRALGPAEILAHYNGIFSDNTGLVGLWHFEEGSGVSASDSSGNANAGTLFNNPLWVSVP